jgi:tripeptide aminopeptidase
MNNRLIQTFFNLVQIDSPTGEEDAVADYIVHYLTPLVTSVQKDAYGNVYACVAGTGEPLFFSAHMDTVEPGRGIKPKVEHGYAVSDGTTILGADNKSSLACMIEAVEQLKELGQPHRPIEFVFTKSEESGNYGAINFDYSLLKAKKGFCFDSATPVGTIISASPFYDRFDLTLIGKEAHASRPNEAVNALAMLRDILHHIMLGTVDNDTIFNIGVINGGFVRNTIPGTITLNGEIRSFVEEKLDICKDTFIALVKEVVGAYKGDYTLEFVRENPGYKHTHKEATEFMNFIKEKTSATGLEPHVKEVWGVSDANIFNDKGLLCFNLGNGSEFAHSVKERVSVVSLEQVVTLIIQLVR